MDWRGLYELELELEPRAVRQSGCCPCPFMHRGNVVACL